ncbi:MAG: beta-ketoacyl synthase N-terminal-like domain-containing protein [Flavobacterium sp.]
MKKCYINGMGCISAQKTFDTFFLEDAEHNTALNILPVSEPDYKEFIPPAMARRMAKVVKNGVAASSRALQEAGVTMPDAIITGTGLGCSTDSEKFLKAILDNNEQFLTPTSFIQSTHNTVGAQIALGLQCKAYNFTYVNGSVSFESSVIDAQLQIDEGEAQNIVIGGVEEIAENTSVFMRLSGQIKAEGGAPYTILESDTKGAVHSEGSVFFVLSSGKQESTYAELKDISIYNKLSETEVAEKAQAFLAANGLSADDVDAVVLGYNGDVEFDGFYNTLANGLFKNTQQLYYKHLSGEFNTASAFGLWMAAKVLREQQIPELVKVNDVATSSLKTILLYNQYHGLDHSFTLLTR